MKKLFIGLLILLILTACGDDRRTPSNFGVERGAEDEGLIYRVLEIEGMHCIYIESDVGSYAGLTCNWQEWGK